MLGNYVNAIAIIIGCFIGLLIKKGLKEAHKTIIIQAIGLSVLFVGAASAIRGILDPDSESILFIISFVIGGIAGELIGVEKNLERLGQALQNRIGSAEKNIAHGFVTATLIFCVGTMAIIGSIESGLNHNHDILFAKAILDGGMSVILASTLGIGVVFSAAAVFIYQGTIVLFAGMIEPVLTIDVIREISIIGGILIFGIGLNILEITKIKTGNLLPAIIVPVIYYFWIIPLINLVSQ